MRVAALHRSYVYERRDAVGAWVTSGALELLRGLGAAATSARFAEVVYERVQSGPVGTAAHTLGSVSSRFPDWCRETLPWLTVNAGYGVGQAGSDQPKAVVVGLVHQVAGVFELLDDRGWVDWLANEFAVPAVRALPLYNTDAKTRLQERVAPAQPEYTYHTEGPDHAQRFIATVTVRGGSPATGEGGSKKAAAQAAAGAYLTQLPQVAPPREDRVPTVRRRLPSIPAELPWRVRQRFAELANAFVVGETRQGLLLECFIHSSWTYENKSLAARHHLQDNALPAHFGSHLGELLYRRALVRHTLQEPPPDDWSFLTMPSDAFATAFDEAGLSELVLMGRGQASQGIPAEMKSNVLQALIAVFFGGQGSLARVEGNWPEAYSGALVTIAPTLRVEEDAVSRLQRLGIVIALNVDEHFDEAGPDHSRRFMCTLLLKSGAIGRSLRVPSAWTSGKKAARRQTAERVLSVLSDLAAADSLRRLVADEDDVPLATFLLTHLVASVPRHESDARRWLSWQLLGAHLVGDIKALREWAALADDVLSRQQLLQADADRVAAFYGFVQLGAETQVVALREQLVQVLDWVEQLEPDSAGSITSAPQWRQIVLLGSVARAMSLTGASRPVRLVFDEWALLHSRDVPLRLSGTALEASLTAATHASLALVTDAALSSVNHAGDVSVEVDADGTDVVVRFVQVVSHGYKSEALTLLADLLEQAQVGLTVRMTASDLVVICTVDTSGGVDRPGVFASAIARHSVPAPAPLSESVAHLLHDLKNQLSAAEVATSLPAVGRTQQLENLAVASRHLDEAAAIAVRLREVAPTFRESAGVTDLAPYLRRYVADKLLTTPSNVALTLHPSGSSPLVGINEASVGAVLDNLIKNSVEALHGAPGHVVLDWVVDDDESTVLLDVSDTGPGIPADVLAAVSTASAVATGKIGGNGLGLLSVAALMRRAGGRLEAASLPRGARWTLVLPLADAPESNLGWPDA